MCLSAVKNVILFSTTNKLLGSSSTTQSQIYNLWTNKKSIQIQISYKWSVLTTQSQVYNLCSNKKWIDCKPVIRKNLFLGCIRNGAFLYLIISDLQIAILLIKDWPFSFLLIFKKLIIRDALAIHYIGIHFLIFLMLQLVSDLKAFLIQCSKNFKIFIF